MNRKSKMIIWSAVAFFVIAAVLSALFMGRVKINYNLPDYLDESTQTKIAYDIIEDEFGMTGNLQIMLRGVSADEANAVRDKIERLDGVLTVNFDENDAGSYTGGDALLIVLIDGDDSSETARGVISSVQELLAGYDVAYGGSAIESMSLRESITKEMGLILLVSILLVIGILLLTSKSWMEPGVLLAASAVAILINLGTNLMFGSISYITNSIAAILQLALSIDYSIVLLHTYTACKARGEDSLTAMKAAIKQVVRPVSASGLTTIAGLVALLFMSFKIGFDIGMVLIKGIVISVVTSLTLLPALVLLLDKPLQKTQKREIVPKGKFFCTAAFKGSKAIVPVALAIIIACSVLSFRNTYSFSVSDDNNAIAERFGENSSVVLVYEKGTDDFAKEEEFIARLQEYKKEDGSPVLLSYTAYSDTGAADLYDAQSAQERFGLEVGEAELLFTLYHLYENPALVQLSPRELVNYARALVESGDPDVMNFVGEETVALLNTMELVGELMSGEYTAEEFHGMIAEISPSTDLFSVRFLYNFYYASTGKAAGSPVLGRELVSSLLETPGFGILLGEMFPQLRDMRLLDAFLSDAGSYDYRAMSERVAALQSSITSVSSAPLGEALISGIYVKYAVKEGYNLTSPVTASGIVRFLAENMETNALLKNVISEEQRESVTAAASLLDKAEGLLLGENYSRLLLNLDLPKEGKEASAFVAFLTELEGEVFGNAYSTGTLISSYELEKAFDSDNLLISIFTVVATFLIVMFIFRSLSVPVVLVTIIQGAIWITFATSLIGGGSMFFMSYIITTCILMGATVDYGILMSNNYVAYRRSLDRKEALLKAVETAMPTVFTSGLILTICGFVISFISSQMAISSVGFMIGKGALISVLLITVVLPSILYLLDKFILKLTLKKKIKEEESE